MPPFDFSIKIEGADKDTKFVPAKLTVNASNNDTVSWGNRTTQSHHPWPTREDGTLLTQQEVEGTNLRNYLSDEIPAMGSSTPTWVAATSTIITGTTIFYCCKLHPNERGTIIVTD
jgi:plastocyanin